MIFEMLISFKDHDPISLAFYINLFDQEDQMSFFIEMPQSNEPRTQDIISQLLRQQLFALIHHPEFNVAVIMTDSSQKIQLALPRGQLAFVRDTRWIIDILPTHLKFTVLFMDYSGINYLRGQSQRIKLQLIILLKVINSRLPIEEEYFVQPTTGIIRYTFSITHKQYEDKLKGVDSLRKLFRYVLSQLHLYAEVVLFCQPSSVDNEVDFREISEIQTVNRYRFLLRNTRKFREAGITYINNIIQIKQQLKNNPSDENLRNQLQRNRYLFQNNQQTFDKMRAGLSDQQKNLEKLSGCIRHINKNAKGQESKPVQSKIVSGIKIIRSGDINSISREGAHSEIFKGKFIYKLSSTINIQVMMSNPSIWLDGRQHKAELILKKCNINEQTSKNSFMNEIYLLNHIRDAKSSYIAKYYLEIKDLKQRNAEDIIYMKPYAYSLYTIIKKSKTLSLAQRLSLSYKLAKGMCFLNYWSILHRDFKPHNIMVDHMLNPVIIDFGSCAPINKSSSFQVFEERLLTTRIFHVYYHEIPDEFSFLHHKFTRKQYNQHPLFDVYSFGRVLSFLFFNSLSPPSPDEVTAYPYPQFLRNILFLITLCLQIDPDQRPAFAEIASFIGSLSCYIKSLEKSIDERHQSFSQPKKTSQ